MKKGNAISIKATLKNILEKLQPIYQQLVKIFNQK